MATVALEIVDCFLSINELSFFHQDKLVGFTSQEKKSQRRNLKTLVGT
jgi:hypothetical protein